MDASGSVRTSESQRHRQRGYYVGMGPDAQIPTDAGRPEVSVEALHKRLKERLQIAQERATRHTQHKTRVDDDLKDLRQR